jgi:hypothetical protein
MYIEYCTYYLIAAVKKPGNFCILSVGFIFFAALQTCALQTLIILADAELCSLVFKR